MFETFEMLFLIITPIAGGAWLAMAGMKALTGRTSAQRYYDQSVQKRARHIESGRINGRLNQDAARLVQERQAHRAG